MAEPDIDGIEIEERGRGGFVVTAQIWPDGNRRHRLARALATLRNLNYDDSRFAYCSGSMITCRRRCVVLSLGMLTGSCKGSASRHGIRGINHAEKHRAANRLNSLQRSLGHPRGRQHNG